MNRSETISAIVDAITKVERNHPLRVAVNGRIASGKTTLATELANALVANGYPVRHVGVDGFHNPRAVRYRQGRTSARGYYEDAYDLDALKHLLLEPLEGQADSSDGIRYVRTASLDLETDTPVNAQPEPICANGILSWMAAFFLYQSYAPCGTMLFSLM